MAFLYGLLKICVGEGEIYYYPVYLFPIADILLEIDEAIIKSREGNSLKGLVVRTCSKSKNGLHTKS